MSATYLQTYEDFNEHLTYCVEALNLSAQAFDNGYKGEAQRLAATVRMLVHDTGSSRSLLGQLGRKSAKFYDTAWPYNALNLAPYMGIVGIDTGAGADAYLAPLDNLPPDAPPSWVDFDTWWDRVIFVDNQRKQTTRKELVLAVANTDGGAHVDPQLDAKYANLSRENSLGWEFIGPKGKAPLTRPELAAVRQIAHETLKSLNPSMPSALPKVKGDLALGLEVKLSKHSGSRKVGRNEPCPCGSGKKYKRCCLNRS